MLEIVKLCELNLLELFDKIFSFGYELIEVFKHLKAMGYLHAELITR